VPGEMEVYSRRGLLHELLGQDFHYPIVTLRFIGLAFPLEHAYHGKYIYCIFGARAFVFMRCFLVKISCIIL
jgi:hypothetical protein